MNIIDFIFQLLKHLALPVANIDTMQGEAQKDYNNVLATGKEHSNKFIQKIALFGDKWFIKVGLAFLFAFVSKALFEKLNTNKSKTAAERFMDDDEDDFDDFDDDDDIDDDDDK